MSSFRRNVYNGLFGYNLVQPTHKEVVLVGRESDALAVYQATKQGLPTVVLPDSSGPLSYDVLSIALYFNTVFI